MRLVTYRSARRRLARVAGAGRAPDVPRDLVVDDRPAGMLTSAVAEGDDWIGLAVLRHEVCDPPRALEIAGDGTIDVPEPLTQTRPLGRG